MLYPKITEPRLVKNKDGWYVYIKNNETKQKKFYKLGLNRIKDLKKREKGFQKLIKEIEDRVKESWSPFEFKEIAVNDSLTFKSGLEFSIDKKKDRISSKTLSMYTGSKDKAIKIATLLNFSCIKLTELKRVHLRQILEKAIIVGVIKTIINN